MTFSEAQDRVLTRSNRILAGFMSEGEIKVIERLSGENIHSDIRQDIIGALMTVENDRTHSTEEVENAIVFLKSFT